MEPGMDNRKVMFKTVAAPLATLIVVCLTSSAWAGGFAAARFGGERGNPTEGNPFSLYYNPGGLGMSEGTKLTLDGSFIFRDGTYERVRPDDIAADSAEGQANYGTGSVSNFLISPAFAFSTDFGGASPIVIGAGFFVPFGGSSVWDTADPVDGAVGAVDGPQRWYTIDGTIQTLAFSMGAAYKLKGPRLSIGLSGNLYLSKLVTIRARNSDGSDTVDPIEGRSVADVESTDFGLGAGLLWEPVEDSLWVGLSWQSKPGFGPMKLEGNLKNLLASAEESNTDLAIVQELPDIFRLGARYKFTSDFEGRLFADYTMWSSLSEMCLLNLEDKDDHEGICATNPDGSYANENRPGNAIQVLQRRWEDTFGVRVGLSYWLSPDFEVQAGAGFDSSAIPDETLEPALLDMNKFTATLGLRYDFTDSMALSLAATNVFYSERDTTGVETAESLASPSNQPSSAGIYNQNIFLLNANLDVSF
jgi:long-chain fatty acid transport protein